GDPHCRGARHRGDREAMAAEVTAADRTTQRLSIAEALDCACAASAVRQLATATGFPGVATEEIVLVCAELASNIVKHAGHGALILRAVQAHDRSGIELDAQDAGPGITNVDAAFADGYSTLGGLGYGLGSVNRLMDEIDIESTPALGTRIVCRRWLRCESEHTLESRWDVGAATRSR